MSDETKQKLLTEKDLNAREKDFLKVVDFAYELGYRRVYHPFGALMQRKGVGFNMQGIYVWEPVSLENQTTYKWKKVFDYTETYEKFITKLKELTK